MPSSCIEVTMTFVCVITRWYLRSVFQKRKHDDSTEESTDLLNTLKTIGEVGKGLVRSIHVVKARKTL